jgi:NTE family protein
MDVPAAAAREMGATRVIAVSLKAPAKMAPPRHMMNVVHRCFQILQAETEPVWRALADLVIEPDVSRFAWDDYASAPKLAEAGRRAAEAALPSIVDWLVESRAIG